MLLLFITFVFVKAKEKLKQTLNDIQVTKREREKNTTSIYISIARRVGRGKSNSYNMLHIPHFTAALL